MKLSASKSWTVRAGTGAFAGALAIAPMTVVFWVARELGWIDEVPPHKAIRAVARRMPEPQLSIVSGVAHTAVGAAAGAVYGVVKTGSRNFAPTGVLFGIGVWLLGYEVVMPAATDIKPAHRDDRRRAATTLVAHLVFGAALGEALTRMARPRRA